MGRSEYRPGIEYTRSYDHIGSFGDQLGCCHFAALNILASDLPIDDEIASFDPTEALHRLVERSARKRFSGNDETNSSLSVGLLCASGSPANDQSRCASQCVPSPH